MPPNELTRAADEHAPESDDDGSGLDLLAYARSLWGYKWLILGSTIVVLGAVLFWTMQQPRIYQASCTIEYDPHPAQPLGQEAPGVNSFWLNQEFFATQNRIIRSRQVGERVVRNLELQHSADFFNVPEDQRAGWRGRSVRSAVSLVQSRLTVEPIPDTRLVRLRVSDQDPERAATLANAIAEAYIEKTIEDRLGSTVTALEWLGNQLGSLREQLNDSELTLHQFKVDHDILSVSMESRQNLVAAEIQHFNGALTKIRTRRIELAARLERVRRAAEGDTPEERASAFTESETMNSLRGSLRSKISEREGLSTRYGPNHQRLRQLEEEITDLRRQLEEEIGGVLREAEGDVREVRRIEAGFRSALDSAHRAGLDLNLREIEYGRLNRERQNNEKLYGMVLERTTETDLTRMLRTTHARMLDRALEPRAPISPNRTLNALAGLGAGFALGLAIALLLGQLDRRLRSVAEIERLGLTILGILPRIEEEAPERAVYGRLNGKQTAGPNGKTNGKKSRLGPGTEKRDTYVHTHPMSAAAECCRTIRTNLMFVSADNPIRSLLVTSPSPREGKTTVATNIAISLAQSGKRVLMVDTDLRRPRIHRAFGVSGARGVTTVIVGEDSIAEAVSATGIPNLEVMPCGPIPPNPSELFHSQKFSNMIEEALEIYDRVVFDSPPLTLVTDAAVVATQVDATLVVIRAEQTTRDALNSVLRQLRDVTANVVGGVMNAVDPKQGGYGADRYYYYRDAGYYTPDGDDEEHDEAHTPFGGDDAPAPPPS